MPKDMIFLLKSKLHHARITKTEKDYVGSVFIDEELLRQANICNNERVEIFNVTNGNRWSTYAVPSKIKREVSINGAGARLCQVGDIIIIISYKLTNNYSSDPKIITLNEKNDIVN